MGLPEGPNYAVMMVLMVSLMVCPLAFDGSVRNDRTTTSTVTSVSQIGTGSVVSSAISTIFNSCTSTTSTTPTVSQDPSEQDEVSSDLRSRVSSCCLCLS